MADSEIKIYVAENSGLALAYTDKGATFEAEGFRRGFAACEAVTDALRLAKESGGTIVIISSKRLSCAIRKAIRSSPECRVHWGLKREALCFDGIPVIFVAPRNADEQRELDKAIAETSDAAEYADELSAVVECATREASFGRDFKEALNEAWTQRFVFDA